MPLPLNDKSKVEVIDYLVNRVISSKETLSHIVHGKVLKLESISFNFPTVFLVENDIAIHCTFLVVHVLTRTWHAASLYSHMLDFWTCSDLKTKQRDTSGNQFAMFKWMCFIM